MWSNCSERNIPLHCTAPYLLSALLCNVNCCKLRLEENKIHKLQPIFRWKSQCFETKNLFFHLSRKYNFRSTSTRSLGELKCNCLSKHEPWKSTAKHFRVEQATTSLPLNFMEVRTIMLKFYFLYKTAL